MSDEVPGCACCAPPSEEDTSADSAPGRGAGWAPESCTLPTEQRPVREAEFDALFAGALQTVGRPAPGRLRLALDPAWEGVARQLAERESRCCSFFTFTFSRDDGKLYMDVAVPADQEPVLAAMAQQATGASR